MKTAALLILLLFAGLVVSCKKDSETPATPKSSQKAVTANPTVTGVPSATVVYDNTTFTYTITLPVGSDSKALKVEIPISTGAKIDPDPNQPRDYTNPVGYTVTAEDGSKQVYTVKVVVNAVPKSSDKQITSFVFAALSPVVSAAIDQSSHKITATVPADANLTALIPTIAVSAKATISPTSGVAQNFTAPVNYTVTAEDGSLQVYSVSVTKQAPITPSGTQCLVTRIEEVNTKDYMTFEYDANGRIVKRIIKDADFLYEVLISYNANDEVTTWSSKRTTSPGNSVYLLEWRSTYNGTKLSSIEGFNNSVSPGPNLITADEQNRVTSWKFMEGANTTVANFTYLNGNMVKADNCENGVCSSATLEYDTQKHFLSNSKVKGVWSFYNVLGYSGSTLVVLHSYSVANNLTKLTTSESGKLSHRRTYSYTYNQQGYPVTIQVKADYNLNTSYPSSETKNFRVTYSNCQ